MKASRDFKVDHEHFSFNRSMLVDMVTADSEYQNNLSAKSALSTSPKGTVKPFRSLSNPEALTRVGKEVERPCAWKACRRPIWSKRRSRLTAQRPSMFDVEKETKRKQEAEERIKRVRQKGESVC